MASVKLSNRLVKLIDERAKALGITRDTFVIRAIQRELNLS
jgi:hypothetical protein